MLAPDGRRRHEPKENTIVIPVEYAAHRKIREHNKLCYRVNHRPIDDRLN